MTSIRARPLGALIILVALISLLAAGTTYRRVLNETSTLFDYQLRQMALSLRSQISLAPRIEVPPDQPNGFRLCRSQPARATLAGVRPADSGWGDSNRAACAGTGSPGARGCGTRGHSAHFTAAHHDRRGCLDCAAGP